MDLGFFTGKLDFLFTLTFEINQDMQLEFYSDVAWIYGLRGRHDLCICIHICWYRQEDGDCSTPSSEVLLYLRSETRSRAELTPSGFLNHSHSSSAVCLRLSVCLKTRPSVCPARLSYGSWHKGPLCSDKWLRLELTLRPMGWQTDLTRIVFVVQWSTMTHTHSTIYLIYRMW